MKFGKRSLLIFGAALLQACASAPHTGEPPASAPAPEAAPTEGARQAAAPSSQAVPAKPIQAAKLPPFDGQKLDLKAPEKIVTIDRTVPPDDLWERVRRGFGIPDLDNELVRRNMAYYAARPEYLQRMFDRSRLYLYHVVDELEKRGMPTELALLPMVESAYNPMAYSRAHASGLWQFIPGTGKRYDLHQSWWYDARRDIVESTAAALEYLAKLYDIHGDWQLALASYNWGENGVTRAIAKNRAKGLPTDYEHLRMPAETRNYIPKLQALKNIIRDPKPFGIDLSPMPNTPYFVAYDQVRDMDVQLAAKLAEMPVEEFIALNPAFSRPIIRAADTPRIILPADKVDVFRANLEKHQNSLVSWKTYYPKKGDTLAKIANQHGMALSQLKQVNGIPQRSRRLPHLLVVPVSKQAGESFTRLPIMYAPPIPVSYRRVFHTVRRGETLASIARHYRVSADDLKRWNHVDKPRVGQRLTIQVQAKVRHHKAKRRAKSKTKIANKTG